MTEQQQKEVQRTADDWRRIREAAAMLHEDGAAVLAEAFKGPAVLVGIDPTTQSMQLVQRATNAAEVFAVLCSAAQHVGRMLGLDLQWVKDPTKAPGLVLPPGVMRPMR